jgi:hypothetical protein
MEKDIWPRPLLADRVARYYSLIEFCVIFCLEAKRFGEKCHSRRMEGLGKALRFNMYNYALKRSVIEKDRMARVNCAIKNLYA